MQRRLISIKNTTTLREQLSSLLHGLDTAADPDALRGYEGSINRILSFSYSLIFSEMQTALLARGLDPYPGFLHDLDRGHPALASDLSEPYRVLIADSFVLTVINHGRVKAEGFETHSKGAVYMNAEARRKVIDAYEAFVSRPLGGVKGTATPRVLIDGAARAMLRVVLGEADELLLPSTSSVLENSTLATAKDSAP